MLSKFKNHLDTTFSFLKDKKLLLATSGGIDSMVMVHLFQKLNFDFAVAHCNFNLRGEESNGDETFVKSECEKLDIKWFLNNFNTKEYANLHKLSIQLAARQLRYKWFNELLKNEGFDFVLTAHHLDDSVETFLINFTRGTGLEGLTGIPQQNDKIVRPLLIFSRSEIENYAKENSIQWREDSSNASDKYLRNKLRHDVIPILKELNPGFLDSFQKTQNYLQEAQIMVEDASSMIYQQVVSEKEGKIYFDIKILKQLPNYKPYLYQWLREYDFSAWDDIYDLVGAQSGKQVFSENYRLLKDRDFLILEEIKVATNETYLIEESDVEIDFPIKMKLLSVTNVTVTGSSDIIFVDSDMLKFPLILRKWQKGDYFYPSGMTGKKKLSKYFKDEKISLIDKENIWLLCSDEKIVWIIGKRVDQRFIATITTPNSIQIEIE